MIQPQSLYLASGNSHKVRELQELADEAELRMKFHSAATLGGMPEVVEDTGTFEGNARKKALALKSLVPDGAWIVSDDSGICVDALDGAPGVESAYFAGPQADDDLNLAKLVTEMTDVPLAKRSAYYVCVLHLQCSDEDEHAFRGECHGVLAHQPQGSGGFGYDPLFIPNGSNETFGVLPADTKRLLSHRALAWANLVTWWRVNRVEPNGEINRKYNHGYQ